MRKVLFSAVSAPMAYSSLGYSAVFSRMNPCEHAWLPDGDDPGRPVAVESGSTLWSFDVVLVSAAWELEMPAILRSLARSGIEPVAARRPPDHPLIIGGGPLTLANPDLLAVVCDAVFVGEADAAFESMNLALEMADSRTDALKRLSAITGIWVPSEGSPCPDPVFVELPSTPLYSAFSDRDNEFSGSFIVEVGRGCPRGCDFCVAFGGRRGRFYQASRILDTIPDGVRRVGLLGAAVSDHPRLLEMVSTLHGRGIGVTLGSLRADRVSEDLVSMLKSGGLKTLTVAADGASERLRRDIHKGVTRQHLIDAARIAARTGIPRVRVYVMLGLPGESPDDLREFADLVAEMSCHARIIVSISPFVPKRFTRMQDVPFAGVANLRRGISTVKKMIGGRALVRAGSVRHAEIEYRLAMVRLPDAESMLSGIVADQTC